MRSCPLSPAQTGASASSIPRACGRGPGGSPGSGSSRARRTWHGPSTRALRPARRARRPQADSSTADRPRPYGRPARDAVLMRVRFDGPHADQLYVRLDPLAGGTGGGGSQNAGANSAVVTGQGVPVASNPNTLTNATNRDYAVPTYMALESSNGFSSTSVGYAGTGSDGLTMLGAARVLTPYTSAPNGHVTLTAGLALPHWRTVSLALGFGQNQGAALAAAGASVAQHFDHAWQRYEKQWLRYDEGLRRPSWWLGAAAV